MSIVRHRRFPARILAAAIVAGLACGSAAAQDDPEVEALTRIRNFIEFGVGYVDDDAYRYGRYNGLEEGGGYGVLALDWFRRAPHDSEDPVYTRLQATELGLDTRRVELEHGRQGRYAVRLEYAGMPYRRNDAGSTPFEGVGSDRLTLPAGWVAAQNTTGMTALAASLRPVAIGHERRRFGLGLDALLARGWEISTTVRHERKDGLKTIGAVIGNSGGNPRAVVLPEPIDYETREAEVALRWFQPRYQLEFRYLVSLFDDANEGLSWQNPFATINGWNAAAGFPNGYGQLALPPDNQFHQASVAGGWNWDGGTRLSADVALGRMTQDESFLPYTVNPVLAASITQPLPRDSLDGRIDTTVANLRLTGRSGGRFDWGASWRYDDRDNRTPRDEYVYIGGDSNLQNVAANSSFRRFNEPMSYRDSRLRLDGGWRIASRTRLTGALERRSTERTYSEREEADETTAKLSLRHSNGEWVSAALRFERADRDGSTYVGNEPFLSGYAPGYTGGVAGGWENPPLLRKFHLADRVRDRVGASVTLTPTEAWSIGLDVQSVDDDYRASELGVTASTSDVFTLDLGYVPSERWTMYAFVSRENMQLDQVGASIRGATREADALDPSRRWNATHSDHVDTTGLGASFRLMDERLRLGIDYLQARADSAVEILVGGSLIAAPFPVDYDRLQSVSLHAEYLLRDDWTLRLRLWNERFHSTRFTLDGVEENQLANVILLGEDSPDYEVNALFATLVYSF
jgi:MtrB/PioB family decaheme-associated outer membrane protein